MIVISAPSIRHSWSLISGHRKKHNRPKNMFMQKRRTESQWVRSILAFPMAMMLAGHSSVSAQAQQPEHATKTVFDAQLRAHVKHIVVIYQENWSFDSLYGQFPGVNGLQNGFDTLPQLDQTSGYAN